MMNVLTTGVTGLVFWIIVARSVAPAVIAQSSAMVTQMLTVVTLSQQGLAANVPVLIAGARNPRRIAGHAYAAALLLSSTGAILFVTVAPRVASGLRYLQRPELTLLFVAGCVVWSIFSLQDAVLVGLMRSKVVLAENASWGVVRLIVVVSLPLLGVTLSVAWIVAAWVVPATALVTVISYFLFGRASSPLRRPRGDHRFDKRKLVAFLGVEQLGAFTGGLIGLSIPAVALTVLGARAAAPFLAAYSIVLVSENSMGSVAQTFAVEVRRNGGASRKVVAFMFLLMGGFSLFVIVVAQLFGENVMGLFGGEYRDSGAAILGILVLGIPVRYLWHSAAANRLRAAAWRNFAQAGLQHTLGQIAEQTELLIHHICCFGHWSYSPASHHSPSQTRSQLHRLSDTPS